MGQLDKIVKKKFIDKTIGSLRSRHPAWVAERSDDELNMFIENIIVLGNKYRIYEEINLGKLIDYQIEYTFQIPVNKELEKTLTQSDVSEYKILEDFYFSLRSERYKLRQIILDQNAEN